MNPNHYAIRFQTETKSGKTMTQTKSFPTEKAMIKWIEKMELTERWIGVLAYSTPE